MTIKTQLVLALALALLGTHANAEWHTLESIELAAEQHVDANRGEGTRHVVEADALDARLKLPVCGQALMTRVPYGNSRGARITVEVA